MNTQLIQSVLSESLSDFNLSNSFGHRAVGDKIEADCSTIVGEKFSTSFVEASSKRSIEDFSLLGDSLHMLYDVKTHYLQPNKKGFSMPNLISVKRLKGVLENPKKDLAYIFVDYTRKDGVVQIKDVHVRYVWELDWSILGIGALGKGQLQIKNANKDFVFTDMGRDEWFKILKVKVNEFYNKQLVKIKKELNNWK
jgi:hypothetical protein